MAGCRVGIPKRPERGLTSRCRTRTVRAPSYGEGRDPDRIFGGRAARRRGILADSALLWAQCRGGDAAARCALIERGYHGGAEQDELAERYEAEDLRMRVRSAMTCLPPRQREVLERYYGQSLTLREAGLRMGISEARACQLHGRAIQNLRRQLSVAFPSHVAASRVPVAA